jgi:nonribosomal peptide synthetase protein BlmVII
VQDILTRFAAILDQGSAEPGRDCTDLARSAARAPVPRDSAGDCGPAGATLAALIRAVAAARPDAIAVSCGDVQVSYGTLYRQAAQLAAELRAVAGAGPETLVGVCADPSPELVIAVLGVTLAGAAYVPVDPQDPPLRQEAIITDARTAALVTGHRMSGAFAWYDGPVVPAAGAGGGRGAAGPARTVPANLAYAIYTSGSTGAPKGVLVTHHNVTALLRAADQVLSLSPADVWTLAHSSAFDFSVWEMWGALVHGARLVVLPRDAAADPPAFWQALRDHQVTVLNATPGAFAALMPAVLAASHGRPGSLRSVILGGERCEPAMLRDWFAAFGDACPHLVNMYGITETTVHVTHRRLTRADTGTAGPASPIGYPLPGASAHIAGPGGVPAGVGGHGELMVGGSGVARGYLGRPALTAARFRPGDRGGRPGGRLYASGDLGCLLPGGELGYLGRADQQIQLRGYRIEAGEVEAALAGHPRVSAAAVTARRDGSRHYLAAYVVPRPGQDGQDTPSPAELRRHLAGRLPAHMVPSAVVLLDQLPLTSNGKLDRDALPAPDTSRAAGSSPPRTPTERALAALWSELLGVSAVGIHDNFFDLGGDSLLVTRLHARLPALLGVDLPMRRVYRALDIASLAEAVDQLRADTSGNARPAPGRDQYDRASG